MLFLIMHTECACVAFLTMFFLFPKYSAHARCRSVNRTLREKYKYNVSDLITLK